jgi:hypothetical protein
MSCLLRPVSILCFEEVTTAHAEHADAPSLQHLRNYQWTPDIMSYTAGTLIKSISYYVQQVSVSFILLICT